MDNIINTNFEDELKIEGINFKGFGVLPKFIMFDTDLTIESKAIYAYLCSYAGNGNTTFPGRDKIIYDLAVAVNTYYKHFELLKKYGYIQVTQENGGGRGAGFQKNIYTLISNPKKFADAVSFVKNKESEKISYTGMKSCGYGIIPKSVMLDPRLPIQAKGIYAFFASLTGAGDSACPKRDDICFYLNIALKRYYKYFNMLIDLNYMTAKQRVINGRLSVNDYYLLDNPDPTAVVKKEKTCDFKLNAQNTKKPCSQICDTQKYDTQNLPETKPKTQDYESKKPCSQICDTQNCGTQNCDAQNCDTNKNSINNNNYNINNLSINMDGLDDEQLEAIVLQELHEEGKIPDTYVGNDRKLRTLAFLLTDHDSKKLSEKTVIDFFENCLFELMTSDFVYKNKKIDTNIVLKEISKKIITKYAPEYVYFEGDIQKIAIENFVEAGREKEIKNVSGYMKSCIWSALIGSDIMVDLMVARDFMF